MRRIRLLKLRCTEHLHRGFLAVGACHFGANLPTGDLGVRQLVAIQLWNIVAKTAVRNLPGNAARYIGRSGCHGGDGFAGKGRSITRGNATKSSAYEPNSSACAHPDTTINNCITDIAVALELTGESGCKSTCSRAGSSSSTAAEHTACTSGAASNSGNNPCCQQQLHAHAGSGLGDIEAHGCQIGVKFLSGFQKRQGAEQPQKNAPLPGGKSAAVTDVLTHRGIKCSKEPDVHYQQQHLGTHHPAPTFEYRRGCFGSTHGISQRGSIAEDTHYDVPLHRFQQQFEIVPSQRYFQNDEKEQPDNGYDGDNGCQSIGQGLLHTREGKILRCHGELH